MKYAHDFFKDFNKLLYWLLIFSSWFITADIYCTLFLNIDIYNFLTKFNIAQILLIFILQIILILSGKILYELISFIKDLIVCKWSKNNEQQFKDNYNYTDLLNESVTTNNQTMYNYYKDGKEKVDFIKYQKRLIFTAIVLLFLNFLIEGTSFNKMVYQYENTSQRIRTLFSVIMIIDIIGIFVFFGYHQSKYFEYSEIRKKPKQNLK